ncbi:hypothetical protein F2Q68_00014431 [Brassica cretica]|uniref:Uncharacterized protein n=2 Tax=Brassica cretica TaxID=69181 RepID=A0ABQ7EWJ1_BRACR|nr:hypothetical protein F2Q68_00014431 [Brassica cretica]KAF3607712.1 hypothetical protein DY000_02046931 [Brassica cretica]
MHGLMSYRRFGRARSLRSDRPSERTLGQQTNARSLRSDRASSRGRSLRSDRSDRADAHSVAT